MKKQYVVMLTEQERIDLSALVGTPSQALPKRRHARVLLAVDQGPWGPALTDSAAAEQTAFTRRTVEQIRQRFSQEGLQSALLRKRQTRTRSRVLDAAGEQALLALADSKAPDGRARWTIRLLTDRFIALGVVAHISRETVREVIKKHRKRLF